MLFTPTNKYTSYSKSINKLIYWNVYTRRVTDLSLTNSGTSGWTDITDKTTSIPSFSTQIEFEQGQFVSDKIQLNCSDINYFMNNIFNSIAINEYVELKIQCQVGIGDFATDEVIVFSGFVDTDSINLDEIEDTITFDINTAQELGNNIKCSESGFLYQNLSHDVGEFNSTALTFKFPEIWLVNAAAASNIPAKYGYHEFEYAVDSNKNKTLTLDGGIAVPLTSSNTSFYIGDVSNDHIADNIYILMQAGDINLMPISGSSGSTETTIKDTIYVTNPTASLPYNSSVVNTSIKKTLSSLYNQIGITTVTFDTMSLNTWDGRIEKSYIDVIPNTTATSSVTHVLTTDGINFFIGGGSTLYYRSGSTGTYTSLYTGSASESISRLFYNQRNNDVWMLYGIEPENAMKIVKYNMTDNTYVTRSKVSTLCASACDLLDYNYTGSSYVYGLLYAQPNTSSIAGVVSILTASAGILDDISIAQGSNIGYSSSYGITYNHLHISGGNYVRFSTFSSSVFYLHQIHCNNNNTWTDDGKIGNPSVSSSLNIYNANENRIYFMSSSNYYYHHVTSSVKVPINNMGAVTASNNLWYNSTNAKVYTHGMNNSGSKIITQMSNGTGSLYITTDELSHNKPFVMNNYGTDLYITTKSNKLMKVGNNIDMFIDYYDINDKTITEAINEILQTYNLVATINPRKTAKVYRRSDSSGNLVNSGNVVTVNTDNCTTLRHINKYYNKISAVLLDNDNGYTVFWDGSTFTERQLTNKERKLEIKSSMLPINTMKDLAKHIYNFLSNNRVMYEVELINAPYQWENFDGAQLLFNNSKISVQNSGTIYRSTYTTDGTAIFEVLI